MYRKELNIIRIMTTGLVTVFAIVLLPCMLLGEEFTDEFVKTVPFEEGGKVVVETFGGSVTFSGTGGSTVEIEATRIIDAKDEKEAQKIFSEFTIHVNINSHKLTIETDCPSEGGFFSKLFSVCKYSRMQVDYRIKVPRKIDIHIDGTSTDVRGTNVDGTVSLDLTSGDVDLEEINGRVLIDGTSGNIKAVDLGGDLIVDNTSGEITAGRITGRVEIDKTSGRVVIKEIGEDFFLDGTSCDVDIEKLTGSAEIDVTSGNVRILALGGGIVHEGTSGDVEVKLDGKLDKPCRLSTTSGDVHLIIARETGLRLDCETSSGGISAKLPQMEIIEVSGNNLKATVADGGVEVDVETVSGDIDVSPN